MKYFAASVLVSSTVLSGCVNDSNIIGSNNSYAAVKQTTSAPKKALQSNSSCASNDPSCNTCAVNVPQQFAKAAAGQINWRTDRWKFDWNRAYPPNRAKPVNIFKGKEHFVFGIPKQHVQGFVRTNSSKIPFAGTHSHEEIGGIFLVNGPLTGQKSMSGLLKSRSRHPSGAAILGQYLVYGESGQIFLKNLNQPYNADISLRVPGPKANFGGGVALTKLQNGSHLAITTGPGGQDDRARFNRFYRVTGLESKKPRIQFLNQSPQTKPAAWPDTLKYAENLSLITECGTGDTYAIHSTGDQDPLKAVAGNGYWRLSKLAGQGSQLQLQPVQAFTNPQQLNKCSMRATGTVYVNRSNRLEFYCHGYAKNPSGSTLNLLGTPNNEFRFMVGTL